MFPLVEGKTLLGVGGRYRFLSRLASGTFAVILKAMDTASGRAVAIKCTHEAALNAIAEREAALLQALNARDALGHVAVVRLLDRFTHQRHVCLVLELLGDAVVPFATVHTHARGPQPWRQARPLPFLLNDRTGEPQHKLLALVYHRRLAQQRDAEENDDDDDQAEEEEDDDDANDADDEASYVPVALDSIRQMAVHLCAALAFVHDQGLIHADLKPENVVHIDDTSPVASNALTGPRNRRSDGLGATVKLVDFGNCIERRQLPLYEADDAADESGGFDIQTLAYRAPEVAMGVVIAPAMDMWSLGCVLVECATGQPLFGETTTGVDGASHHSLANSVELIAQIEWLLTGGVPLGRSRPQLYANARHYKYRAATGSQTPRTRPSPRPATAYLPLRRRLEVHRPDTVIASEWADFQDFVERLLDIDPATRLTARAAFVHPFLQKVFPFQFIFAPALSVRRTELDREIDTSPSDPEEDQQQAKDEKKKTKSRTMRGKDDGGESVNQGKKKKRHVSGSLKHALELIPNAPSSSSVKKEPTWS